MNGARRVGLIRPQYLAKLVPSFAARHGLRGLDGLALAMTLAMLRPTGLTLAHAAGLARQGPPLYHLARLLHLPQRGHPA